MHAIERADYIKETLKKNKVVTVADLSREIGVTEETIRKDLEKLEGQQVLCRVHGGAYLNEGFGAETPVTVRSKIMPKEKAILARRCMELIKDKETIFLDCSTSMQYLADELSETDKKLTVLTNSLPAAEKLAKNPAIRLILFGGEYNRDTGSFEGETVLGNLKNYFIDKVFFSSAGISLEAGITDATRSEAEIRRQVIRQAKCRIMAADSTKIGRNAVYVIGAIDDIDYLVTDQQLKDEEFRSAMEALPVVIVSGNKR